MQKELGSKDGTLHDALKTNTHLWLTRKMCDRLVVRHNFLAGEAEKNGVLPPGSAVVARLGNKSVVRGVVKYATYWEGRDASDLKRVAYKLVASDHTVMHSAIIEVLHERPGEFSTVNVELVPDTIRLFGLELDDRDKIVNPETALTALKTNNQTDEDIGRTDARKICEHADIFFAARLVGMVCTELENERYNRDKW